MSVLIQKKEENKQKLFVMYIDGGNLKIIKKHKKQNKNLIIKKIIAAVMNSKGELLLYKINPLISIQQGTEYGALSCFLLEKEWQQ